MIVIEFQDGSKIEMPVDYKREAERCHEEINKLYRENTRLLITIFYMILSCLLVFGLGIWIGGLRL